MSIKKIINQNQSIPVSSATYVIKYKLIFMLCIVRKMSARIVYFLMIETSTEIHLSVNRYENYGTFRDRGSYVRMHYLIIWFFHEMRLLSYSLRQIYYQKDSLISLVTVTAMNSKFYVTNKFIDHFIQKT